MIVMSMNVLLLLNKEEDNSVQDEKMKSKPMFHAKRSRIRENKYNYYNSHIKILKSLEVYFFGKLFRP